MKLTSNIQHPTTNIQRMGGCSSHSRLDVPCWMLDVSPSATPRAAFSLIEVLVVVSLMSLIVLALMAVFSSTQQAFRASVTQTDVLEGSRATVDLITSDLRGMTPCGSVSNNIDINFYTVANDSTATYALGYAPLVQNLPGSGVQRTNLLNWFFVLGRENQKWSGTGYIVDYTSTNPIYPLYRFYAETNITSPPWTMFNTFNQMVQNSQWTNMSHVMDGVVHLVVRACDTNGLWINNNLRPCTNALNTVFYLPAWGESQFYMLSNTVPVAVELQLGVLEDRVLARAESLPNNLPAAPPNDRRTLYLSQQAGRTHLFRQRVTIPNVDFTAYQ